MHDITCVRMYSPMKTCYYLFALLFTQQSLYSVLLAGREGMKVFRDTDLNVYTYKIILLL